jgi:Flp pilus assembly protein TadB
LKQFYRQQLWHANRRSYRHIMKASGGRVGGNAPLFAFIFLFLTIAALAGILAALFTACWSPLALALPLVAVITLPALVLCARARTWRHFPALCVIYAAYGCARAIDLLGLTPQKTSWKS